MLKPVDIRALIPHQRGMCLLEEVVSWDEVRIRCRTGEHRNPQHPLRGASGLLAVCGIEFAAQAVAVHGGLMAAHDPSFHTPAAGYLANAKNVRWSVDRLDVIEVDLTIDAEQLISEGGRSIYAFCILADERELVRGQVAVVLEQTLT